MSGVVHVAKSMLAESLLRSGALRRWQRRKPPHVLILAYHRVTPEAEMAHAAYPAMHVSTRSFEAQLEVLKSVYRVVPMAELQALLAGNAVLHEPVAVVTFDDGYRDNYQHAFPILVRQGVPATFFLSLGFVEAGQTFWFDRLAAAAGAWEKGAPERDELRALLPAPLLRAFDLDAPMPQRLRLGAAALKSMPDAERLEVMRLLAPLVPMHAGAEPLRWREVRAMVGAGMRMGAHGINHAILTRMSPQEARQEMAHSLEAIGRRLGTDVCEFAYPNGDTDDRIAMLAAQSGVQLGFTMAGRDLRPGEDLLRLGRRNVCEDTSRDCTGRFSRAYFLCEITGVFDAVLRRSARAR
jgi:peptidoglycan/xylan/chitin deacetylase (PgdA/CDA1 family)